jgi:hypothetical protein
VERRLVGAGPSRPVLVQLVSLSRWGSFPAWVAVRVGTGRVWGWVLGTLLGPEGSGFGWSFGDWVPPGGGPARAGSPFR